MNHTVFDKIIVGFLVARSDLARHAVDITTDCTSTVHTTRRGLHGPTDVSANLYIATLGCDIADVSCDRNLLTGIGLDSVDVTSDGDIDLFCIRCDILAIDDHSAVLNADVPAVIDDDTVHNDFVHGLNLPFSWVTIGEDPTC